MKVTVILATYSGMQFTMGHCEQSGILCRHLREVRRGVVVQKVRCLSYDVTSGSSVKLAGFGKDRPGLRVDSPVYAVYDERLEQDGAVVGFTGEFVDHSSEGDNVRSRGVRDEGREGGERRGTT